MQGHLSHERLNGSRSSARPHGTGTRPWRPGGWQCGVDVCHHPLFRHQLGLPFSPPAPPSLMWKVRPLQVLPSLWLVPRSSGPCGHVRPAVQGEFLRTQATSVPLSIAADPVLGFSSPVT